MDRPAKYQVHLDAAAASAASLFRTSRSCVVVLTNCTSIAWRLTSVNVRRGGLAGQPPPEIMPWCFAVFGAQSLAAHAGAGCNGVVRYASRAGHIVLELQYDVPYAGTTAAHLDVRGVNARSIETSVRSRDGDGYGKAFFLSIVSRNGPSRQPLHGALSQ
jgi:hypothetical protein